MEKRKWKIIKKRFFIERTNADHSSIVVSRYNNYNSAIAALEAINKTPKTWEDLLRHELWSYDWVNTDFGFAPIAWIN